MKITFLEDTNIRRVPRITGDPPLGVMFKGSAIEVEAHWVQGDMLENNDHWYLDKNGWYYWSGRAEKMEEEAPPDQPTAGVIVMPAPEQPASEPTTGQSSTPVILPPLANDDALLSDEAVPEGETRRVPPLELLLAAEQRIREGAGILPKPVAELEPVAADPALAGQDRGIESVLQTRDISGTPAPMPTPPSHQTVEPEPAPVAVPEPAPWENPESQKMNWGVEGYLIARDWWKRRQLTGRSISVAILSTGIEPAHPDLAHVESFYQCAGGQQPMSDRHGLGTQAAVIAAGAGQTVFGVAPEARLLIGKLAEQDHSINPGNLIEGLRWAIGAEADIIAMLVDFPEISGAQLEEIQQLIHSAVSQHIWLVAPVGTVESKKPESRYPARLPGVFSVGAHDRKAQRSIFSTRSYDLDILAPGEGLLTASPDGQIVLNQKSTSIAAAFAAGFLALVRQWNIQHGLGLDPEQVFNLLRQTAASPRAFNKGEDVEFGYGILNPIEILKQLESGYQGLQ